MLVRDGISVVSNRQGKRFVCSPKRPDRRRWRYSRLFSANRGYFPGVNLRGREFKLQSPFSPAVKNEWSYASIPPTRLRDVDRDNFNFSPSMQLMFWYLPGRNGDDIEHCSQRVSHTTNKNFDLLAAMLRKSKGKSVPLQARGAQRVSGS